MGPDERRLLVEAFDSNWIAPLGPHVDEFEREMCDKLGCKHALALSSGTAALHLALINLGVGPGDEVYCSSLTFSATANTIVYCGGRPVFVDSTRSSWNMDPALLADELDAAAYRGRLPKAIVLVDIYGQCADFEPIRKACEKYGVPIVEDAAESLGSTYKGKTAGTLGDLGILSFNGNKIITTSGGGMLLSDNKKWIDHARHLATQSKDPAPHYQHSEIGYNYRMSNLLAAVGIGQLRVLEKRVSQRRDINRFYREALSNTPGVEFMPEASYGMSNCWLTGITVDPEEFGATREDIRLHLENNNIESRPVWKPMNLQPVFRNCRFVGEGVCNKLFDTGLCLPSGSSMTLDDLSRVVERISETPRIRMLVSRAAG